MTLSWKRSGNGALTDAQVVFRATNTAMVGRWDSGKPNLTTLDQIPSHSYTSILFSG